MATFHDTIAGHQGTVIPHTNQVKLGTPAPASLGDDHKTFINVIVQLLESGRIHPDRPSTFIKQDVYDAAPHDVQALTDRSLPNICSLLHYIYELHYRKEPDDSAEMKALIESLWQAKQRVEKHADVFFF